MIHRYTVKGICWSTEPNPDINDINDFKTTINAGGLGVFSSNISGLISGTKYYVRAYATNEQGTGYGNEVSFTTLSAPTVTTNAVTVYTHNSAECGGNVTSDGGKAITEKGICRAASETQPAEDCPNQTKHTETGTGPFTIPITDLTPNTKYYVRAYAVNDIGPGYGTWVNFKTKIPSDPGNINNTDGVTLSDAIISLQIAAGITPTGEININNDVNADGIIGLENPIYILQDVAGLRP